MSGKKTSNIISKLGKLETHPVFLIMSRKLCFAANLTAGAIVRLRLILKTTSAKLECSAEDLFAISIIQLKGPRTTISLLPPNKLKRTALSTCGSNGKF